MAIQNTRLTTDTQKPNLAIADSDNQIFLKDRGSERKIAANHREDCFLSQSKIFDMTQTIESPICNRNHKPKSHVSVDFEPAHEEPRADKFISSEKMNDCLLTMFNTKVKKLIATEAERAWDALV